MKMFATDLAEFRMNAADTACWDMGNERNAAKLLVMKIISYSFLVFFCYATRC